MKNKFIHICYFFIIAIAILNLQSCEEDLSSHIPPESSKIWVNAIVGVHDVVKIYVGNTSGLNSDDKAQYRNDAIVQLRVNGGSYNNLAYKIDPKSPYKGYYYTNRLEKAFEGDTLSFISWIPGSDFDTVKGVTYIPRIPVLSDPDISVSSVDGVDFLVNVDLELKDTIDTDRYFEIKLEALNYSDIHDEYPSGKEEITLLNDLKLPYGLTWNEKLKSVLIDYESLEDYDLNLSFKLKNNHSRIKLGFDLKKVTKEYYEYFKALDGGSIVNSNITNGSGIFAGYSGYYKEFDIK